MIKLNKSQKGFTVVELVIVVLVIVVLIGLVSFAYSGIQAKSNNTKRQSDIQAMQTQLEAFYSQNGYYPSLTNVNSPSWRKAHMPNLNPADMIDPSSNETTSNVQLSPVPAAKVYSYHVTDSNGNSCESDDTNCAKYTLTATLQGKVNGSSTYSKQNLD